MSLKKIEQIKKSKWFSLWDIAVFAVIIALSVAVILYLVLGRDKKPLDGFFVESRGTKVFEYDFVSSETVLCDVSCVEVVREEPGCIVIRVYTDGRRGFNEVTADTEKRHVSVTESNCSTHKDCVYTPKLTDGSSTPIVCTPHELTVCPTKSVDNGEL